MSDPLVDHPAHYQRGGIETIDYIRGCLSAEQFIGYCMGNVLKYASRYRDKDGLRDLKKASVYLGWAVDAHSEHDPTQIKHPGDLDELRRERGGIAELPGTRWPEWRGADQEDCGFATRPERARD